nr:MAG TPA: hypothetical protein [Caudoviricetes sp.]
MKCQFHALRLATLKPASSIAPLNSPLLKYDSKGEPRSIKPRISAESWL